MKIRNIIGIAAATVAISSCGDKMDYHEYSTYDEDYVKTMFSRAAGIVTSAYNDLDTDFGNYSGAMLSSATDESVYSHAGNTIEKFYNGGWSATSNNDASMWVKCYRGISYANLFLDKFKDEKFLEYVTDLDYPQELGQYNNLQYEARFLRAYYYFELVRAFGGVPLLTSYMEADEANSQSRRTSDEVFQFIIAECDGIKNLIEKNYASPSYGTLKSKNESGRANNLAVLALKARAALYYASPLFNPTNDNERWHQAAVANKELIDECKSRGMKLSADYAALFQKDNWKNTEECIFVRRVVSKTNTFERYNFPVGLENAGGGNCPTYNLVESYEPGDIRLTATVAQNGDTWPNATLETFVGGANGMPIAYATPTGYYLKKYVQNLKITTSGANTEQHHWVTFRLGEFYLNYAEAILNYTNDPTAKAELGMSAEQAINVVRQRAGIGDIPTGLSATEFAERLEKERFVELAFEGHRFYDLRRNMKAGNIKYRTIKSMYITKNDDGTFNETVTTDATTRAYWDNKMYLFPIAQSEILKSGGSLTQNPGW